MAYHDHSVVVRFRSGSKLVNGVDDMMRPDRWKSFTHYVIKEISQVTNQNTETMLEELYLVTFLI